MARSTGRAEDRLAIRELVESYNDAVFRHDAVLWRDHWADDGEWHIAGQVVNGQAAIVALWSELMAGFALAAMYATGGGLTVAGDHATGRWYMLELLQPRTGAGLTYVSCYDDDYTRSADGLWRFARRRYTLLREV